MLNPIRLGRAALAFLFATASGAEDSLVPDAAQRERIAKALPAQASAKPQRPRRPLIFNRNIECDGHRPSILAASEAFTQFAQRTGAFEATISEDPALFDRESLRNFDAVFLNNIGSCVAGPERRKDLLEFVTAAGGLMGVHGTSVAFTIWQWPPLEDWAGFGHMLGARGANHRGEYSREWLESMPKLAKCIEFFDTTTLELTANP